ncbi:MAG TPA: PTS sugar transporter subunit IIA [Sediminispirochaeta sp.]|nr:PTS sugar transporter subunit IIA [Sediminispirochaeta sp.]
MALLDLISPEIIRVPLESKSKEAVIRELLQVLIEAGKLKDFDAAYEALLAREAKGSTGLEDGIAVPHAKTDRVDSLTLAIGIAPEGIDFRALDGKPSYLFFLMLAPPDQSGPHIEALSEIARLTQSKSFCKMLRRAENAEEVADLLTEEE